MTTKKQSVNLTKNEIRDSRIRNTKNFILNTNLSGILNNQKWYKLFELIDSQNIYFEIKILLEEKYKSGTKINELESTSILIDYSGNFIEFLEIETLLVQDNLEIKMFCEANNIDVVEVSKKLRIDGYR